MSLWGNCLFWSTKLQPLPTSQLQMCSRYHISQLQIWNCCRAVAYFSTPNLEPLPISQSHLALAFQLLQQDFRLKGIQYFNCSQFLVVKLLSFIRKRWFNLSFVFIILINITSWYYSMFFKSCQKVFAYSSGLKDLYDLKHAAFSHFVWVTLIFECICLFL